MHPTPTSDSVVAYRNETELHILLNNINSDSGLPRRPSVGLEPVDVNYLINTLNMINFQDGTVLASFKNQKHDHVISLKARPQQCYDSRLDCVWEDPTRFDFNLTSYDFLYLSINDGLNQILIGAEIQSLSKEGFTLSLHHKGFETTKRKIRRNNCQEVNLQIFQNGEIYDGRLLDFHAVSFCAEISSPNKSYRLINTENKVYVVFKNQGEIIYSGSCEIIQKTERLQKRTLILKPLNDEITKFKTKEMRFGRQKLIPKPNIIFTHPVTGKKTTLPIFDMSGTGFATEESAENAVLLPGMIIPDLGIELMSSFVLKCKAQVIYSKQADESTTHCGLAILDMSSQDHIKLTNFLYRVEENNSYVCTTSVDLDNLWSFFFEAGFVYPQKYTYLKDNKEKFKKLYKKLYSESPDIARHIIYQDRGKIYGHAAMLRTYEKTWMVHHHAAITSKHCKAGLVVMTQLGRYIKDYYPMKSSKMDYVICYFRPENRFPNRIFGDVTRNLQDPKRSSMDTFAYFHYRKNQKVGKINRPWSLNIASTKDLRELKYAYEHKSGGLMIQALDLDPDLNNADSDINQEYQKLGFKREHHIYSLKNNNVLQAIFIVNVSDVGMNMSELTNCIHAIVLDQDSLDRNKLQAALNMILHHHIDQEEIPILLYPTTYADKKRLTYDKKYHLWIMSPEHGDYYFKHIEKLLYRNRRTKPERREDERRQNNQPAHVEATG